MIIGLEGLPRSGKSYNAIRQHLIPAVQRGREVITNVAGTNHEAIAEVSGVPLEQVRALVHVKLEASSTASTITLSLPS